MYMMLTWSTAWFANIIEFVHNAMVRMLCDYILSVEWFKPKVLSLIDIFDGNDCGP